jgi:hypothetical protein
MLNTLARASALPRYADTFPRAETLAALLALVIGAVVSAAAQDTIAIDDQKWQECNPNNVVSITYSGTTSATAFDLVLTYDTGEAAFVSAAVGAATSGWTIDANETTVGTVDIALATASGGSPITTGEIVQVTLDTTPVTSWADTDYDTTLTNAFLLPQADVNDTAATAVGATLVFQAIVHADATGNDTITAYDCSFGLQAVVDETTPGWPLDVPETLPAYNTTPDWSTLGSGCTTGAILVPLNAYSMFAMLDVDENNLVQAADIAEMLQYSVGKITTFSGAASGVHVPPAPSADATPLSDRLRGSTASARPGSTITVSLDLNGLTDVLAGELLLDFDPALIRPTGAVLRGAGSAMVAFRDHGRLTKVAFASDSPVQGRLDVVFETVGDVRERRVGAIRDAGLTLNTTRVHSGFDFAYEVRPYGFRLMPNFPNPFNPETWIPFELEEASDVSIHIYGMDGRPVRTLELGNRPTGVHADTANAGYWDGRNDLGEAVASGAYVYELRAGSYRETRRMVVLK